MLWWVGLIGCSAPAESEAACDPSRFKGIPVLNPEISTLGLPVDAAECFLDTRDVAEFACATQLRSSYELPPDSGVSVFLTSVEAEWPTPPADYPGGGGPRWGSERCRVHLKAGEFFAGGGWNADLLWVAELSVVGDGDGVRVSL